MTLETAQQVVQVPGGALKLLVEDQPDQTLLYLTELFVACIRWVYPTNPECLLGGQEEILGLFYLQPLLVAEESKCRFVAFLQVEDLAIPIKVLFLSSEAWADLSGITLLIKNEEYKYTSFEEFNIPSCL